MLVRELLMMLQVGVCFTLVLFCIINKSFTQRKKYSLLLMIIFAMILAVTDCLANMPIQEDIIRISKFLTYLMPLLVILAFNQYLKSIIKKEKLQSIDWIITCAIVVLILSQFTGWYYTFSNNVYERGKWYVISYVFPILSASVQCIVLIKNRKNIKKETLSLMLLFIILPIIASISHIFIKGISLISISTVFMVVLLYSFSIIDTNQLLMMAHQKELENLREKEQASKRMKEEIASALVGAIDAKDSYTQGHSRRVSEYSVMIAKAAGMTQSECDEIEFIGLLHDVGKIGIPSAIINKTGKLTDEEFETIKRHPLIGRDILDKISSAPNLRIGASYHHERYDGKGYPFGLKGEEIPVIARIIAVADSYDAMTSKRSYRDALPQAKVREQFVSGSGTQFDPVYAEIMVKIIDSDKDYNLRQH